MLSGGVFQIHPAPLYRKSDPTSSSVLWDEDAAGCWSLLFKNPNYMFF